MKKILLTGATGQLGQEFQSIITDFPGFELLPAGRQELDITQAAAVDAFFSNNRPDYCVNTAAYTAVDRAESEPDLARRVNVEGVSYLAAACAGAGIPLIHFSSDYVYHTEHNRPYLETDRVRPQSVYARTKLAGEEAARSIHAGTIIIRTSWVYSSFGHNFVKTMLRLGRERTALRVVYDQIGAPTYARDLAQAVMAILTKAETDRTGPPMAGIYHYSNEGVCSWYDFALAIFEFADIDCRVSPILTAEYPTAAPRPPFSLLNKQKIRETFGLDIPHWRESLRACLALIEPGS